MPKRIYHADDSANHYDHEKKKVRIDCTAKTAESGVDYGCHGSNDNDSPLIDAEKHLAYLDGGKHHQSRCNHIEHDSKIYRTESAQKGGSLSGIAQFVEFDVALGSGTDPQFGVHEHGHLMENFGELYVGYEEGRSKSTLFGWKSLRLAKALEPGYVFTVEPGIYFIPDLIDKWRAEKQFTDFICYDKLDVWRGFGGIRNEEDYLVTEAGARRLGKYKPMSPEEIEAEHNK